MAKVKVGYGESARDVPVLAKFSVRKDGYDREHADLWLEAVYQDEDGKPRYFSDYQAELAYQNLMVTAYLKTRTRYESDHVGDIFGLRMEYRQPFSVEANRAVVMGKTLSKAQTKLTALTDSEGYTDDYAITAIRMLKALGVEGLLIESEHCGWQVRPLGELTRFAWRAVQDAKKAEGVEA